MREVGKAIRLRRIEGPTARSFFFDGPLIAPSVAVEHALFIQSSPEFVNGLASRDDPREFFEAGQVGNGED